MAAKTVRAPKIVLVMVGVLAASLVTVPFLLPKNSTPDPAPAPTPIAAPSSAAPTVPSTTEPSASPSDSASSVPLPSDTASASSTQSELLGDPLQAINKGLSNYQQAIQDSSGVKASLVTADGQSVEIYIAPNGDYRALTGVSTAPEWLFVGGKLYARLGEKELKAQKDGLAAIGKPNALWTDAAVGADKEANLLAAGNIANAVADLIPLMDDIVLLPGEDGTIVVQGTVDLANAGSVGASYGLQKPSTDSGAPLTATVAFTIDKTGVLTGYIVSPPNGGQPVSVLLSDFTPVKLEAPSADLVVTLEDLAKAAAPTAAPAPPVPAASTGTTTP